MKITEFRLYLSICDSSVGYKVAHVSGAVMNTASYRPGFACLLNVRRSPNGLRTFWGFFSSKKYQVLIYCGKETAKRSSLCSDALGRALTVTPHCLSAALWWHHCGKLISASQLFSLFLSVSLRCISFDNTTFIISTGSICAIMFLLPPLLTVKTRCNTSAEACVAWIIEDISSHELISAARLGHAGVLRWQTQCRLTHLLSVTCNINMQMSLLNFTICGRGDSSL